MTPNKRTTIPIVLITMLPMRSPCIPRSPRVPMFTVSLNIKCTGKTQFSQTDWLAYENGFSALLLHLVGTLPVVFRGNTYRFPVALWIPNTYPREPPMVYVTPPQDMVVRVGQHVTLEGRVYHHYLAHWAEAWDVS